MSRMVGMVLVALLGTGCSMSFALPDSKHKPESRGRISLTARDGGTRLVKDGRVVRLSPSNLLTMVGNNPKAREAACRYRNRKLLANIIGIPAAACAGWFTGQYIDQVENRERGPTFATRAAFYGCGSGLLLALLLDHINGENLYDAINIYNDDIAAKERSGAK